MHLIVRGVICIIYSFILFILLMRLHERLFMCKRLQGGLRRYLCICIYVYHVRGSLEKIWYAEG